MARASVVQIYSTILYIKTAEDHLATIPQSLLADYPSSLKELLGHEGGYTNDPQDPGGPTNWGITIYDARMYWKPDATAADVKAMPLGIAQTIYKAKYWNAVRGDELPAGVDYCVFDYGVNSGVHRAIPTLQRLVGLVGKDVDGQMGPVTMAAVATKCATLAGRDALIQDYQAERLRFLQSLKTWPHFGGGWGTRVKEVRALALKMSAGSTATVPRRENVPPAPKPIPPTPQVPAPAPQAKTGLFAIIAAILRAMGIIR